MGTRLHPGYAAAAAHILACTPSWRPPLTSFFKPNFRAAGGNKPLASDQPTEKRAKVKAARKARQKMGRKNA